MLFYDTAYGQPGADSSWVLFGDDALPVHANASRAHAFHEPVTSYSLAIHLLFPGYSLAMHPLFTSYHLAII